MTSHTNNNEKSVCDNKTFDLSQKCDAGPRTLNNSVSSSGSGQVAISKNRMKKESRLLRIQENKLRRRKIEKERQNERVRMRRREGAPSKKDTKILQIANLQQSLLTGVKICIDLQFEELMSDKELIHLASQLRRVYGSNKAALQPFHLVLVNLNKESRCYQTCCAKNEGFEEYIVDKESKSLTEVFDKETLVYLTPDSESVIEEFLDEKVYVIGGLVDESVKKSQTASYAKSAGIQTGRLPIQEYMGRGDLGSFKTILTINQVFDIILKWHETKNWVQALSAGVPQKTGFVNPSKNLEV